MLCRISSDHALYKEFLGTFSGFGFDDLSFIINGPQYQEIVNSIGFTIISNADRYDERLKKELSERFEKLGFKSEDIIVLDFSSNTHNKHVFITPTEESKKKLTSLIKLYPEIEKMG